MDFRILGPVEVAEHDRVFHLGRGRQRALLALLVLHANEVVSQARLVDELWGESPPATASTALHGYVSRLRKLLGPDRLETSVPGYRLRVDEGELDRDRFVALAQAGRHAEALALWRGPPLADIAYEPFAQEHIALLEELRLACLESRIDDDLAAGAGAELVGELEALVRAHPLRERFRAQLMLALYRSGRQAEALDAYQAAREALVGELGLEPGEELRTLQKQILVQDPELGARPSAPAVDRRRPGRRRWLVVVLAVLVAAAAAAATAVALHGGEGRPPVQVADSVVRIDPATNEVSRVVPVGAGPFAVATSGRHLWVANRDEDTVTRIDTRTWATRTFGGFAAPVSLAADGRRVWIGSDTSNQVVAVDGDTGVVLEQLRLKRDPAAYLDTGGGALWVTHDGLYGFFRNGPSTVSRVDLATREVTTFDLGDGAWATGVAYGRGAAWVLLTGRGEVVRIGARDGARQRVAVGAQPFGVAVAFDSAWVPSSQENTVRRVNAVTGAVEDVVHVGRGPFAVAAGAGSVWVASQTACTIARIDPATNSVVATIPLRFFPTALHVGGGSVWVTLVRRRYDDQQGAGYRCPNR
jgi:YVTN family beta-propeller protein